MDGGQDKAVTLTVTEVVPSLNKLLRMHWSARRKLIKKWQWLLWLEISRAGGLDTFPKGKVEVRITRSSYHALDQDNLNGSAKIVLDALKINRVIPDDSPHHIALICDQDSGRPSTRIQVSASVNALTQVNGSSGEPVLPNIHAHTGG